MNAPGYKRPESVLVVVYTRTGKVLLLQRADDLEFWQSITGSMRWEETAPLQTARRELGEETGIYDAHLIDLEVTHRYAIRPQWRHRYAPEVTDNLEHAFALELPAEADITLNPAEHAAYEWLGFERAAAKAWSWTNREVIELVARQSLRS